MKLEKNDFVFKGIITGCFFVSFKIVPYVKFVRTVASSACVKFFWALPHSSYLSQPPQPKLWPIFASFGYFSPSYALFGAPFTSLNSVAVPQDKQI